MEDGASEQQSSERQQIKGGTLSKLADIRLGPVSVNLRILLEPIGFLRILLLVISIFAFSLTAGFASTGASSQATCTNTTNASVTVVASFAYPYQPSSFQFSYPNMPTPPSTANCTGETILGMRPLSGSAQFYVGMAVLTFLYCLVILPVYVFVYTVTLDFSKYVAIVDCAASLGATVFFAFANIAWSAGTTHLSGLIADTLRSHAQNCLNCDLSSAMANLQVAVQPTVQLSFSLLCGWVMMVIWGVTIWFSYKETILHINRMGPLYVYLPMLIYKVKGGKPPSDVGAAEGGSDSESRDD